MHAEGDKLDAGWLPQSALCFRCYDRFRFRSDMRASLILTAQIFPVSIAIALASGLRPIAGIFCAAAAGLLAAGFGESKVRICAPNILFVAVASGIASKYGVLGLSLATSLAGIVLIFLAATGLATAIPLIPRAIIAGLSSGVAVLVVSGLVSDLFGVRPTLSVDDVRTGAGAILQHATPSSIIAATATVALILLCRKVSVLIPAGLIAIAVGALLVKSHHLSVQTIGSPYGSVVSLFHPSPAGSVRLDLLGGVLGPAFAVAMLSAFQSLGAMDLASSLAGERFSARVELLVQGAANIASAFAGGLPLSGSEIHTTTNVRGGGQTPAAGMLQAVFLLVFFFLAVPLVPSIPLPVISGILLASVCTMSHWGEIPRLAKVSRRNAGAWLASSLLAVATDLLTAVAVGMFIGIFLGVQDRRGQPLSRQSAHW